MQSRTALNITTYGLLSMAGAISFMLPDTLTIPPSLAAPAADEIRLTGLVRDFMVSHPDFGVPTPTGGYGNAAGSVELWLPQNGVPELVAGGFKVDTQWRDMDGRPIAPHMYQFQGVFRPPGDGIGFRVRDKVEFKNESMMDAFDSNYGPYGIKGNYGGTGVLSTNSTSKDKIKVDDKAFVKSEAWVGPGGDTNVVIKNEGYLASIRGPMVEPFFVPDLFMPDDLPVSYDDEILIDSDTTLGSFEMQEYIWAGKFEVKEPTTTLTIDGDVLVRCDTHLKIEEAQIVLLPGATLTFYVDGQAEIKKDAIVNAVGGDTAACKLFLLSNDQVKVKEKAHVYMTIIAPDSELLVEKEAQLYGGFIGDSLKVEDKGTGIHADLGSVNPITQNSGLVVGEKLEVKDDAMLDGFDSTLGVYGGANVGYGLATTNSIKDDKVKVDNRSQVKAHVLIGPQGKRHKVVDVDDNATFDGTVANLYEPVPLPILTPPTIGPSQDKKEFKNGGPYLIDSNVRYKELKIENTTVQISGDVVIRIDKKLEMKHGIIELLPDSSLLISIREEIKIEGDSAINMNTGDPSLVVIQKNSPDKKNIEIKDKSQIAAYIQANQAKLTLKDDTEYFGSFIGKEVKMEKNSKFHVDTADLHLPTECFDLKDVAGLPGVSTTGGVLTDVSFRQWFTDVPGVNMSAAHTITMTKGGTGAWEYSDSAFYPIDDRLLGNESATHNYNFTYTLKCDFVYTECVDQFVEFEGGDGAWLYVNGILVLDIGGVRTDYEQYVELDRLGLESGQTYRMVLYVAQRQGGGSTFRLRTNVPLTTDNVLPPMTASFD